MAERYINNVISIALELVLPTIAIVNGLNSTRFKNIELALGPTYSLCPESTENINSYGAIILFGADENGPSPTEDKTELLKGVATAYTMGYSDRIIVVGHITNYEDHLIFKQLKGFIKKISNGQKTIERTQIDFINHAFSFGDGMSDLKKHMAANNITHSLGITRSYYTNRLRLLSINHEVDISIYPDECFIDTRIFKSPEDMQDKVLSENILILETLIDEKQVIPGLIKEKVKDVWEK